MEEALRKEVEDLRQSNALLLARQKELLLEVGRLESELKRRNENLESMGNALEESRRQVASLQTHVSKDVISPPSKSGSYYSGTPMSKLIANDRMTSSTGFAATRKSVSTGNHPDPKHDVGKENGLLRQWKHSSQPSPNRMVDTTSVLLKRGNSTSTMEGDTGSETLVGSDFSASSNDDDNSVDTQTMDNRGSHKSTTTTTRPSLGQRDFPGSSWISRSIRSLPSMRSTSGSRVWVDQDDAGPCALPPRKLSSNNRRLGTPPIPPPLFGGGGSSSLSCKSGGPMMTMRRGSSSSARSPMDDPSSSINLHEWAKENQQQHPPLIPMPYRSQSLQQRQNGWW